LTNFYTSLISNGSLNWDLTNDLCDQTGVVCDSSNPKRVIQLYLPFFISFLDFFEKEKKNTTNRNLSNKGLLGSISSQLSSLPNLQNL